MTSYLITFIAGAFTGAAAKYLADKYTDKRRKSETVSEIKKSFVNLATKMPELIKEMKDDFSNPQNQLIRELFILPSKKVAFNSSGVASFFYYEDQHENLVNKITLLENHGFVYDITSGNTPKFRMTEEFVDCVLKSRIKSNKITL